MSKGKQSIEKLFSQLAVHSEKEEHEQVLECANSILAQSPEDDVAGRLKVTALIKLDKYEQAYKAFENKTLKNSLRAYYAYVCYKLGKFDELERYQNVSDRPMLHVLAQAAYKQENTELARRLYAKLDQSSVKVENEDFDLQVNYSALDAQKALNNRLNAETEPRTPNSDSYDQVFNTATVYIGLGDYDKALQLLGEAKMLCTNSDMSSDEISAELAPILIQAAYVSQLKGNSSEAQSILGNVEADSGVSSHVLENNKLVAEEALANPHTALEQIDRAGDAQQLAQSEVHAQSKVIGYNRLILQNQGGRNIKNQAKKFTQRHPDVQGPNALSVLAAAGVDLEEDDENVQLGKVKRAFKDTRSLASGLVLAQYYSKKENYDAASCVVESVYEDLKSHESPQAYMPGLVSVLISLYKLQNRDLAVTELLTDSLSHWVGFDDSLVQMACAILIGSPDPTQRQAAAKQFKNLYTQSPENTLNIAGMLASGADGVSSSSLPSIDDLIAGVDAEQLNENGVHPLLGKRKLVNITAATSQRVIKKRKRLPKDYDPSKTPDPERWLPKRDRSTWRPKRKEKKNATKNTQGSAMDEPQPQASTSTVKTSSSSNNKKKNKKKGKK